MEDKFSIRKAKLEDMEQVMSAHSKSIKELCSHDYTAEQIASWSRVNYDSSIWEKTVTEDHIELICINETVEGFCHSNGSGELVGLYFTPKILGKSYAKMLVARAIIYWKSLGLKKAKVTGTKTALPFYKRVGFEQVAEKSVVCRGAELECFLMEMNL